MTLGKGNHLVKVFSDEKEPHIIAGEAYHRFEVLDLTPTYPENGYPTQWVKLRVVE